MSESVATNYGKALTLVDAGEDELFKLAIAELDGKGFDLGFTDYASIRARLEKWWSDYRGVIHKHLCTDELRFLRESSESTRGKAIIIIVIADCLSGVITGLSPFTATSLVVHFGLCHLFGG